MRTVDTVARHGGGIRPKRGDDTDFGAGIISCFITGGGGEVKAAPTKVLFNEEAPGRRSHAKPKLQELANYTRQLANLLKAGMPLTSALSSMISLEGSGVSAAVSEQLLHDVREGHNLSAAVAKHPGIFPEMYVNMIKAGESGGSLVEVLLRLAEHYERFAEVRQKVTSALVYPAFVVVLGPSADLCFHELHFAKVHENL